MQKNTLLMIFLRIFSKKKILSLKTFQVKILSHALLSAFGNNALVVILWNIYSLSNT